MVGLNGIQSCFLKESFSRVIQMQMSNKFLYLTIKFHNHRHTAAQYGMWFSVMHKAWTSKLPGPGMTQNMDMTAMDKIFISNPIMNFEK